MSVALVWRANVAAEGAMTFTKTVLSRCEDAPGRGRLCFLETRLPLVPDGQDVHGIVFRQVAVEGDVACVPAGDDEPMHPMFGRAPDQGMYLENLQAVGDELQGVRGRRRILRREEIGERDQV